MLSVIFSSHLIYKDFFVSAGCQGPRALPPPLTVRGGGPCAPHTHLFILLLLALIYNHHLLFSNYQ